MSRKICLLVTSLSSGGAEKVAANMSIALSKREYAVTIFSMQNKIDYPYKGTLYNFGLDKEKYGKAKAFLKLKRFFAENNFQYIIDHRLRDKFLKEVLLSKYVFNKCKVIYCVHNYRLEYYFSFFKTPWLTHHQHVKKARFVAVCKMIQNHLKKELKIDSTPIYNFINFEGIPKNDKNYNVPTSYIIGAGRLTNIKQFDKLIRSYKYSELPRKEVNLVILGSGPENEKLNKLVFDLELQKNVKFIPFTENPYMLIEKAKALVLTSKVEGFPMVLLEALTLKTPVVAFNCKSGPNEIIKDKINGLLVENQNEDRLTSALNDLLNIPLYNRLKTNTSIGLEAFSEEKIMQEWEALFKTFDK